MITFRNAKFKTREINLPKFGQVLISTTSLNDLLLSTSGAYVSDEASFIDEKIFYFVEENQIEMSQKELKILLIREIG